MNTARALSCPWDGKLSQKADESILVNGMGMQKDTETHCIKGLKDIPSISIWQISLDLINILVTDFGIRDPAGGEES